ncbi:MAG: cation:proton antiporter [Thermoanaerobaculia bacterium]|nr:cation:proton antiporter [Thermoanaerobaculia bacterium]
MEHAASTAAHSPEIMEAILGTFVAAVFLGILAQVVAHRWKLPAILPLLIVGMAAGPSGLGVFDPSDLGHGLEVIIHLGVAVILFEGGLSLQLDQLRKIGGPLRNLLTVGTVVTGLGGAALAHYITGVSWSTAALFGAIVTVTGPTVIAPLLRHMVAPKKVRTLLLSEGLMIDPIGAVLAYLVLQWIKNAGLGFRPLAQEIASVALVGCILGFVAGALAVAAVRYRHLGEELRNLTILALLMGSFLLAEHQAPQSGILASVVMGLTVSAAKIPDLSPLKAFKGQLTVLIISVLFILLSGRLDLDAMLALGWHGALVVAGLILVVRPLSVLVSISPGKMSWRERVMVGLAAPRGIVAAAVASLAAIQLRADGLDDDAVLLEGLVYLVIIATCAWATLMSSWLPRALGFYGDPSRKRVVLVGANGLSSALARLFQDQQWTVVVVDSVQRKLTALRERRILAVSGDARESASYDDAGVERDTLVVAMTTNDELNLLVAELVRNEFGVEHPVVVMQQAPSEFGQVRRAWVDLLGQRDIDIQRWGRRLEEGSASILTIEVPQGEERQVFLSRLREEPQDLVVLFGWKNGHPHFDWNAENLSQLSRLSLLVAGEDLREEFEDQAAVS